MGQQSRLKKLRREQRMQEVASGRVQGSPLRILRSIHKTIQNISGENGRRCWEYLLEMLAHSTGWQTDTKESVHLWEKMPPDDGRWLEFMETWMAEVEWAKRNGGPFSEPLGELLEEIQGANEHLGQYFTPMAVVHLLNQINIGLDNDDEPPRLTGLPTRRALDPCCGTGRFAIDALVHHDNVMMNCVDTDIWMVRCAMMNIRLLASWTSLRVKDPGDLLRPLRRASRLVEEFNRLTNESYNTTEDLARIEEGGGDTLIIGGRAIFIHGDALVVDLNHAPNWLVAGWSWGPRPWRGNLKIEGYPGTYDQWVEDGRPARGELPDTEPVQFDFSMADKQPKQSRRSP